MVLLLARFPKALGVLGFSQLRAACGCVQPLPQVCSRHSVSLVHPMSSTCCKQSPVSVLTAPCLQLMTQRDVQTGLCMVGVLLLLHGVFLSLYILGSR